MSKGDAHIARLSPSDKRFTADSSSRLLASLAPPSRFTSSFLASARFLYVESCFINRFNFGLDFGASGRLVVTDTSFKRESTGIRVKPGLQASSASITHCRIEDGTLGLDVEDQADVVVRDTLIGDSVSYGVVCKASLAGKVANVSIENSSINGCATTCSEGIGIMASATAGFAKVWLSNTTVTQNKVGVQIGTNAIIYSFQNNRIAGNVADVKGGALRPLVLTYLMEPRLWFKSDLYERAAE
ncbi:MAG: hypothetical protein QOH41_1559 [Blastocatellia bacterium]|nr:hypothetical protein [Blastocatellia bacterium]